MRDVAVLIPAGGVGTRLGRRTPKQFLSVGGEAILAATVRHFRRHPRLAAIIVAAPAAHVIRARRLLGAGVTVVTGGATRQESVRLALEAAPHGVRVILVHDAVRPFITRELVDAVLAAARGDGQTRARRGGGGDGGPCGPLDGADATGVSGRDPARGARQGASRRRDRH